MRRLVAFLCMAIMASCTASDRSEPPLPSPTDETRPVPSGSLRFGVYGAPATLDPYAPDASDLTWSLVRPLYPSLYRFDAEGRAEPYLGELIESGPRGATVRLREMRWSSGRRVTSGDVISSWDRAGPDSGFARVRSMRAAGNELVLRGRVGDWPKTLASRALVLPSGQSRLKVSGGPLAVASYVPRLKIAYEPGPLGAGIERITVYLVDSVTLLLDLLESGKLDAAVVPSTVNLSQRLETLGLDHVSGATGEQILIGGAQATSLRAALDASALQEGLLRSDGEISGPSRPQGAGPSSVTLAAPRGDQLLELMQEAIQLQLLGRHEVEIVQPEFESFYAGSHSGDAWLQRSTSVADGAAPLARVSSYVVWRPGSVTGISLGPAQEGAFWDVQRWRVP